jgi:excinuclease ABC subunit A
VKQVFLYGSGEEEIPFRYDEGGRVYQVKRVFEGVIPNMERRYRETDFELDPRGIRALPEQPPLRRLRRLPAAPEALAVKIAGLHVGPGGADVDPRGAGLVRTRAGALSKQKNEIARAILKEIRERLGFLNNVGLEYLTLSPQCRHAVGRRKPAHPAGQPDRLGLTGVLYVLDEPSIGLHQRDNDRLLTTLKNLRDQGNTVIVVEHDEEAIREADYVFDIGPGAGVHGGAGGGPWHAGGDRGDTQVDHRAIPVRRPRNRRAGERRKGNGKKK